MEENAQSTRIQRRRRIFCIHEGQLHIVEPSVAYSHASDSSMGRIPPENDSLMDSIVRGFIDEKKDVYVYTGYDFRGDAETETIFFATLRH